MRYWTGARALRLAEMPGAAERPGLPLQLPPSTLTASILLEVERLAPAAFVSVWNHSCSSSSSKMALPGRGESISARGCMKPSPRRSPCRRRATPGRAIKSAGLPQHTCFPSPASTPTLEGTGQLRRWESHLGNVTQWPGGRTWRLIAMAASQPAHTVLPSSPYSHSL